MQPAVLPPFFTSVSKRMCTAWFCPQPHKPIPGRARAQVQHTVWSELSPLKVSVDFAELEANFAAREAPRVRLTDHRLRASRAARIKWLSQNSSVCPPCIGPATVVISLSARRKPV